MRRSDLGEHLYERRVELGLTREQVGASARLDPGYVTYLEEQPAWPSRETVIRLAIGLDTSVNFLLGYQERDAERTVPPPSGERREAAVLAAACTA
jgi:transcriptional regulator with XRE-family HTH domain